MGTNHYLRRIMTEDEKEKLIKAIEENRIKSFSYYDPEINDEVCDTDLGLDIHIGKSSYGWKYIFDHNEWKHYHNLQSLYELVEKKGYHIEDEYGREIPLTEFKELVESKKDLKSHVSPYLKIEYRDNQEWDTDFE